MPPLASPRGHFATLPFTVLITVQHIKIGYMTLRRGHYGGRHYSGRHDSGGHYGEEHYGGRHYGGRHYGGDTTAEDNNVGHYVG